MDPPQTQPVAVNGASLQLPSDATVETSMDTFDTPTSNLDAIEPTTSAQLPSSEASNDEPTVPTPPNGKAEKKSFFGWLAAVWNRLLRYFYFIRESLHKTKSVERKPEEVSTSNATFVVPDSKSEATDVAEETPQTSKPDGAAMLRRLETEMQEELEKEKKNVAERVYSRKLIQLVRDISKNFNAVKCPLEETKLREFGIDRSTMPAVSKLRVLPDRRSQLQINICRTLYAITLLSYYIVTRRILKQIMRTEKDALPLIADEIFSMVVRLPDYIHLYADLCKELHLAEQNQTQTDSQWSLCGDIVEMTKNSFEQEIANDKERIGELTGSEKLRMMSTIKFIANLYRVELLDGKVVNHYISVLLQNIASDQNLCNELMVEYAVTLIKGVGRYANKIDSIEIDSYVGFLDRYKSKVSDQVRFMIVDLEEMMRNKWQKKDIDPETKEEVNQEFIVQEDQNKHEQADGRGRKSSTRQPIQRLERSANAWIPDFMKNKVENEETVEFRVARIRKEFRGRLNKITPSNYAKLSREMTNMKVSKDKDCLLAVVELIFVKAVEEPTFVAIYVDLCNALHIAEKKHEGGNFQRSFYNAIIRKTQRSFQNIAQSTNQEAIERVKKEMAEETDKQKIADHKKRIDELMGKEKRRMKGLMTFIAHLYRVDFLNSKVINHCIVVLLRNIGSDENSCNELMAEYAVTLIKEVGPYAYKSTKNINSVEIGNYIRLLDHYKSKVSNRVRFMIMDVEDMSKNGWQKKDTGPKTKEKVKQEAIKRKNKTSAKAKFGLMKNSEIAAVARMIRKAVRCMRAVSLVMESPQRLANGHRSLKKN